MYLKVFYEENRQRYCKIDTCFIQLYLFYIQFQTKGYQKLTECPAQRMAKLDFGFAA